MISFSLTNIFYLLWIVISEIGDTAALVNCLDLKSLTDMWKYFGKLASVHGEKIRSKSPQSIIQHFASLEEDIMSLIFSAIKVFKRIKTILKYELNCLNYLRT